MGRLREARQGPAEAWTAPTKGACPQEDCAVTRVKDFKVMVMENIQAKGINWPYDEMPRLMYSGRCLQTLPDDTLKGVAVPHSTHP